MHGDPACTPVATASSLPLEPEVAVPSRKSPTPSSPKKRKTDREPQWVSGYRAELRKMHEERMEMERTRISLEERRVQALERLANALDK
jgi:hypothetical protein